MQEKLTAEVDTIADQLSGSTGLPVQCIHQVGDN